MQEKNLNSENLFKAVESIAAEILDLDMEIIENSNWWTTSGYTTETFKSVENFHLFEREIFCLSYAAIGISGVKIEHHEVIVDTIEQIAKKNYSLRNAIVTESSRTSTFFFDFVYDRYEFYLDEILLCYERKNPFGVKRILYYQYHPMDNITIPELDNENLCKAEGIVSDLYLESIFKEVTLPTLFKQFRKSFNSIK